MNPPWLDYTKAEYKPLARVREIVAGKTKLAAWFVSNCADAPSRRSELVSSLQKFIQVDIYGKCGPYSCTNQAQCRTMVERDYRFYFAFENSLCVDYVTEKVFAMMKKYVIPVVYGAFNYQNILPPHSYVAAEDFASTQELAEFLVRLSHDEAEYMSYFWWREHYVIDEFRDFCDLCVQVSKQKRTGKTQYYEDLDRWHNEGTCRSQPKIDFS